MGEKIMLFMLGAMLGVSTWMDIRKRQVSVILLVVSGVLGLLGIVIWNTVSYGSMAGGMAVGILVAGLSKLTKGEVGLGDGWLLCVTGIYLGIYRNMELLLTALFLAAVWGALLMVFHKADRKTRLPFVPFLMVAYIGICLS